MTFGEKLKAARINTVLENEYAIAEQLEKQKDRIKELETSQATVIILGSEGVDQLPIPDTP